MLRASLLAVALLLTLCGVAGLLLGYPVWAPTFWALGLLVCVAFERWRYDKPPASAGGNWQVTGEKFVDPESGRVTEVLYDPDTGERRYVLQATPER